jgi:hypothetical protein
MLKRLKTLDIMLCTGPTCQGIMELMKNLPQLTWLGVSAAEEVEGQEILALHQSLGLRMNLNIFEK